MARVRNGEFSLPLVNGLVCPATQDDPDREAHGQLDSLPAELGELVDLLGAVEVPCHANSTELHRLRYTKFFHLVRCSELNIVLDASLCHRRAMLAYHLA